MIITASTLLSKEGRDRIVRELKTYPPINFHGDKFRMDEVIVRESDDDETALFFYFSASAVDEEWEDKIISSEWIDRGNLLEYKADLNSLLQFANWEM